MLNRFLVLDGHHHLTILTLMLTLTEGSRPSSDADAVTLAMSEEEDRLIQDALYSNEPEKAQESCTNEQIASTSPSGTSMLTSRGNDESSSPTKDPFYGLLAPSSSSPAPTFSLRRHRPSPPFRPLLFPYKKSKPSEVTGATKTQSQDRDALQSSPTKVTSSSRRGYDLRDVNLSPSCLGRLDLNGADSSPTSGSGLRKPLGPSSSLKVNQSTDSADQPSQLPMLTPSGIVKNENASDNSNRPKTRMSLDTRLIGRRVAGGSWSSMKREAEGTDASKPPTTPKKRKESVDGSSSPPRSSRRPRVDGLLSPIKESPTGGTSEPWGDKDARPKQSSSSTSPSRPQTPEDTSIVISPSVTPTRLKALTAKKRIRHRLVPFSPAISEVMHRQDEDQTQSELPKHVTGPLPEIVITPPLIACPASPIQQDLKFADHASEPGAFLATLHASGRPKVHCVSFGDEMHYGETDATYTSTSSELVLSRLVHQREKDDQRTRVLMLGMFREHLKQISNARQLSPADLTQARDTQAVKSFLDRLTRALSRKEQEFWVPDSLKVVSMDGVPQEVSDKWVLHLYRQEVLELADALVVDIVNCVE
ncbi:hypothetical protein BCV69DRAFT_314098 [Microstroma glucosiphilum]|uniref:Uncharacterized protein n=1 Tax=Pseudomicrostroma glucosiphilum TaxID=1684307 RepID=A0A316U3G1_9BASI|nr:hypothetical protein BCV69DRAFT_314098 [Pseudomicrostroma glucosiphilum]PWN18893.1 hypothetical protein BCV69DRAFT_314098 [Pseudomicrostroma glucosiphilum]